MLFVLPTYKYISFFQFSILNSTFKMHLKCVKFTYLKMQKIILIEFIVMELDFWFCDYWCSKIMNNNFYFKNRPGNIYVIYLY